MFKRTVLCFGGPLFKRGFMNRWLKKHAQIPWTCAQQHTATHHIHTLYHDKPRQLHATHTHSTPMTHFEAPCMPVQHACFVYHVDEKHTNPQRHIFMQPYFCNTSCFKLQVPTLSTFTDSHMTFANHMYTHFHFIHTSQLIDLHTAYIGHNQGRTDCLGHGFLVPPAQPEQGLALDCGVEPAEGNSPGRGPRQLSLVEGEAVQGH